MGTNSTVGVACLLTTPTFESTFGISGLLGGVTESGGGACRTVG